MIFDYQDVNELIIELFNLMSIGLNIDPDSATVL